MNRTLYLSDGSSIYTAPDELLTGVVNHGCITNQLDVEKASGYNLDDYVYKPFKRMTFGTEIKIDLAPYSITHDKDYVSYSNGEFFKEYRPVVPLLHKMVIGDYVTPKQEEQVRVFLATQGFKRNSKRYDLKDDILRAYTMTCSRYIAVDSSLMRVLAIMLAKGTHKRHIMAIGNHSTEILEYECLFLSKKDPYYKELVSFCTEKGLKYKASMNTVLIYHSPFTIFVEDFSRRILHYCVRWRQASACTFLTTLFDCTKNTLRTGAVSLQELLELVSNFRLVATYTLDDLCRYKPYTVSLVQDRLADIVYLPDGYLTKITHIAEQN